MATRYELHCTPETAHWGSFSAAHKPVLRVKSGDQVTMHCISGGPEIFPAPDGLEILPEYKDIHAKLPRGPGPHILTGPVYVEGAKPGDTLEVRVLDIKLRQNWGYNSIRPLRGTLPEDFPILKLMHIPIDRKAMVAELPWGTRVPLHPFFGIMGVAPPPVYGTIGSAEPREHGGNVDLKELGVGSSFHLPVWTEGALFSAGDGHAVQGDGEVCLTALETSLSGTFEFIVHKGTGLKFPRAETPTHLISMGMNEDLDQAAKQAVREMIVIICERLNVTPEEAYRLCSLAVDFHVTQLVDGNKGIHGMLPKALLKGS